MQMLYVVIFHFFYDFFTKKEYTEENMILQSNIYHDS